MFRKKESVSWSRNNGSMEGLEERMTQATGGGVDTPWRRRQGLGSQEHTRFQPLRTHTDLMSPLAEQKPSVMLQASTFKEWTTTSMSVVNTSSEIFDKRKDPKIKNKHV